MRSSWFGEDAVSEAGSDSSWRMEEVASSSLTHHDNNPNDVSAADSDDPISLFRVLLAEYRQILQHLPSGIVVAPAFHTILEWHGVVHVKEGYYRGGVFKFVINVPVDYPASAPAVYFFTSVFHPLVDTQTGRLDITIAFPTWKPGRDYIVLILAFIKKMFFKRELNSYLVSMPRNEFQDRCMDCVAESQRLIFVSHPNSPIPFAPLSHDTYRLEQYMNTHRDETPSSLSEWIFTSYIPNIGRSDPKPTLN